MNVPDESLQKSERFCEASLRFNQLPPRLTSWRGLKPADSHLKSIELLPLATSTYCSESTLYLRGKTSVDSNFLPPTVTLSPAVIRTRFLPTIAPVRSLPKLM